MDVSEQIGSATTQVFFSGGHGGLVTYDGNGGPMVKEGGPIDRVFALRSEGELGGDHGLDITYGSIDFRTGRLTGELERMTSDEGDSCLIYRFEGVDDDDAIRIVGSVPELDLPMQTVLFSGSVEASEMRFVAGDKTRRRPTLPYTALHRHFSLHPAIEERFQVKTDDDSIAVCAWCKHPPVVDPDGIGAAGFAFRTQQHLGSLRIYV